MWKSIKIYEELIIKMTVNKKIKTIVKEIEQSKAQYDLDRQTTKISTWSLENFSKYKLLTSKDVLPEKDLLEKDSTLKIFEYSPSGK